jgi:hypothetical protein
VKQKKSQQRHDQSCLNALKGTFVVSLVADPLFIATKNSMTDTPSWLSKENAASAPAPAAESFEISSGADNNASRPTTIQDDADLPYIILMMRLANMGVAIALMACSVRSNDGYRLEGSWHFAVLYVRLGTNCTLTPAHVIPVVCQ